MSIFYIFFFVKRIKNHVSSFSIFISINRTIVINLLSGTEQESLELSVF